MTNNDDRYQMQRYSRYANTALGKSGIQNYGYSGCTRLTHSSMHKQCESKLPDPSSAGTLLFSSGCVVSTVQLPCCYQPTLVPAKRPCSPSRKRLMGRVHSHGFLHCNSRGVRIRNTFPPRRYAHRYHHTRHGATHRIRTWTMKRSFQGLC